MRFLDDNALSPRLAEELRRAGHDAVHVRDLGMHTASDGTIFDRAVRDDRCIVSADTDFGTLLVMRAAVKPSVILLRHGVERRPRLQAALILHNLAAASVSLEDGCLLVLEPERMRVRALPLPGPARP